MRSVFSLENNSRVVHLVNVTTTQPAALASHFLFQKDARKLRARGVPLDSLTSSPRELA